MADRLDVAERLAEGRLAVQHTESYVRACHALGFQHPDLTAHPAQVREWYGSEDGLDLRLLDRDCAELRAAGEAVTEALRMQRAQVAELAAAWTGPGADAALAMLERHCDTANTVATELRAAAQRCESLRDNLWYLVDSKVATAIALDDHTQSQRQAWLAAAAAVTTRAGDRAAAEQVVRHEVMPYLDNDIRDEWLTAMRSTRDGVATSYDMVTDRMAAAPAVCFEIPGVVGPSYAPLQAAAPIEPAVPPAPASPIEPAPVAVAPAAAAPGPPAEAAPAPDPATPPAAPDWGTALGDASGMPMGDLGGGLNGGGGLAGLAGRIVDAIGGLIGSAGDGPGGMDSLDGDPFDEDPFPADDTDDAEPDEPDEPGDTEEVDDTEAPAAIPVDGAPPVDAAAPQPAAAPVDVAEPVVSPEPAPPAADPASPVADPAPAPKEGETPCEIAADQLPQAG